MTRHNISPMGEKDLRLVLKDLVDRARTELVMFEKETEADFLMRSRQRKAHAKALVFALVDHMKSLGLEVEGS